MVTNKLQEHFPVRFVIVPVGVLAEVLPGEAELFRDYVLLRALAWRGGYRVTPVLAEAAVRDLLGLGQGAYRARLAALEDRGWLVVQRTSEGGLRFRFPETASRTREVKNHDQNHDSLKNDHDMNDEVIFNDLTDDLKNKESVSHDHHFNDLKADHDREDRARGRTPCEDEFSKFAGRRIPGGAAGTEGGSLRERALSICAATGAIWDEPIWEQVAERIAERVEANAAVNDPRLPDIEDLVGWIASCHHKWIDSPESTRHPNAKIHSPERVVGTKFLRGSKPARRYREHPERFLPQAFFARAGLEDPGAPFEAPEPEGEEGILGSAQALWQELVGAEEPPGADGVLAMWLRDGALVLNLVDPQKADQLYRSLQERMGALPPGSTVRISLLAPLPQSGQGSTSFKATRTWELEAEPEAE